ncbi:uncharacterized protein F4822DRAFT_233403 [Hypoxylon trugodes]|uniref:uncharacterized protein n=1 Tax=Hypoxylon trugodes TaxID=326681 RepID=UPI00218F86AB|nr:uncharacterized protein F4822DRAFT_233403 [Hypoxylon trugodes]KAI1390348.1 hypothetical protein F4822DRAFT_233403 [Hypoxylon trugodes]
MLLVRETQHGMHKSKKSVLKASRRVVLDDRRSSLSLALSRQHRRIFQQKSSLDESNDHQNESEGDGEEINSEEDCEGSDDKEAKSEEDYKETDDGEHSERHSEDDNRPDPHNKPVHSFGRRGAHLDFILGAERPDQKSEPTQHLTPKPVKPKVHSVQITISDDRTHDSEHQRESRIYTALNRDRKVDKNLGFNRSKVKTSVGENEKANKDKQPGVGNNGLQLGGFGPAIYPGASQDYQMQSMLLQQQPLKISMAGLKYMTMETNTSIEGPSTSGLGAAHVGSGGSGTCKDCFQSFAKVLDIPEESALNLESLQAYIRDLQGVARHLPKLRYQIVHRIDNLSGSPRMYLDPPLWIDGANKKNEALVGNLPIRDIPFYLEKNPEVCFMVYRNYTSSTKTEKDPGDVAPCPEHRSETIDLASEDFTATMMQFMNSQGFNIDTTEGSSRGNNLRDNGSIELSAPYPAIYHTRGETLNPFLESLGPLQQEKLRLLVSYVTSQYGDEYDAVKKMTDDGKIMTRYLPYLFKPGGVVVQRTANEVRGFLCNSWATPEFRRSPKETSSRKGEGRRHYFIKARCWTFDGVFSCKDSLLDWDTDTQNDSVLEVEKLNIFPLEYASKGLKARLRNRGEWFWKCRTRHLVSYHEGGDRESHYSGDERYMVDMAVYRELHKPEEGKNGSRDRFSEKPGTDDLGPEAMKQDKPPTDEFLYLLPTTIKGFNLRKKKWLDLKVDNICEVTWNTKAFERLVLKEETKRLVRALVSDQIETEMSTDLINGKGNGLILLLHGGPGTGKTLTAESVAEIAQKPLYPVTCGDIGTEPEDVETYLESVLHLGKTWGCVVLLDEADVFLEQRSLEDLRRNALVSVFLRVLEYYEGILVLTSNRVGTFDEAFRSRIQLSIGYKNLDYYDRIRIWDNFIARLEELNDDGINYTSLKDHVKELAEFKMNGREIRNAITLARQYSRWNRKQPGLENDELDYRAIRSTIETAAEFNQYIQKINDGYTSDQVAKDLGWRWANDATDSNGVDSRS